MTHKIHKWNDIKSRYEGGSILLGNGASIAISQNFSYGSIKEKAKEIEAFSENASQVFKFFGTPDFELVLRMLWHATNVNQALDVAEDATSAAYREVRDSLIRSVQAIHPEPQGLQQSTHRAANFLSRFKHVVSLNYDLTAYWAMLLGNDEQDGHAFKDCFVAGGAFDDDWRKFSTPIPERGEERCTTVFYPHGNLALCRDQVDGEYKIKTARNKTLLDTVLDAWQSENYVPLFVSEGTSEQKRRAIGSSDYLSTVYRSVLPSLSNSLTVYGWGFGEHDVHLLKQLGKSDIRRIAVSCYKNNQRACDMARDRIQDAFARNPDIEFFDADSPGCWINDEESEQQEQ